MKTARNIRSSWQYLSGAIVGLALAIGSAHAAAPAPKGAGNTGATCANPKPMSLPTVLNGAANVCLVTAGTIDSVASRAAETFTINGVSYANQSATQLPARIKGNYYVRYVAKQSSSRLQVNGRNSSTTVNYTLAVATGGSGSGSASLSPGNYSYKAGSPVTISATPFQGSAFSGWSGSVTDSANPLTITMDGNKSLTAYFAASSTVGLKSLASFPIGVAVNAGGENNSIINSGTSAQQQAVVFPNVTQMTAWNIMKMGYLHPQETTYTCGLADVTVVSCGCR